MHGARPGLRRIVDIIRRAGARPGDQSRVTKVEAHVTAAGQPSFCQHTDPPAAPGPDIASVEDQIRAAADRYGRKPGYCPQRRSDRTDTGDVKSRAGRRVIGLPGQLTELLEPSRTSSGRPGVSSGTTKAGCSLRRLAGRSARTPTTANGSTCSRSPACARRDCTTPDIQPRPCSSSSASQCEPLCR